MTEPKKIPLPTEQIMASLPTDESINPGNGGYVFTHNSPAAYGTHVPAYRDPGHLAAWLYGFSAANELAIRAHHEEKN